MKKEFCTVLFVSILMGFASPAFAKNIDWTGSGGWGLGLPYNRSFDARRIHTVEGNLYRFEQLVPQDGMSDGLSLVLKNATEIISVHLGPKWYMERQEFPLYKGEYIEVAGSRTTFDGEEVIIATEVRTKDKVLKLREQNGVPLWSAWRKR